MTIELKPGTYLNAEKKVITKYKILTAKDVVYIDDLLREFENELKYNGTKAWEIKQNILLFLNSFTLREISEEQQYIKLEED